MPQTVTLIKPKQVLAMLPFLTYAGLYAGSWGTSELTRYPVGRQTLYCKEEVEVYQAKIVGRGRKLRSKDDWENRKILTELV